METPYLFVYGTLMGSASGFMGQSQRDRLADESVRIGSAFLKGRLYDLGRYPGVVLAAKHSVVGNPGISASGAASGAAREAVHGDVVELISARQSLRWLDAYEGVSGDGGRPGDEYVRRLADVVIEDGDAPPRPLRAWVYVYQGSFDPMRQIRSGRWRPR